MNDYKERFRESFGWLFVGMSKYEGEILAFIDEVVAEQDKQSSIGGYEQGRKVERAALIGKIGGMQKGSYSKYCEDDGECFGECPRSYDKALDNLLIHLRSGEDKACICNCHEEFTYKSHGVCCPGYEHRAPRPESPKEPIIAVARSNGRESQIYVNGKPVPKEILDKVDKQIGGALRALGGDFSKETSKNRGKTDVSIATPSGGLSESPKETRDSTRIGSGWVETECCGECKDYDNDGGLYCIFGKDCKCHKGKEERCTRCQGTLLSHHHRHYTHQGVYHTSCYNKL